MHRWTLKASDNLSGESLWCSDFTARECLMSSHIQICQWNCKKGGFKMNLLNIILYYMYEQNANSVNFIIFRTKCSLLGAKSGVGDMELPQVPQGQLATSISRSQTPAFLKSWGCFWRDVWKSSIYCLLTVDLRTLKCQVLASGQVGFVSPHTDGWWDHLHWIIPLVCEQFSKWWIQWELLQYICWTLL